MSTTMTAHEPTDEQLRRAARIWVQDGQPDSEQWAHLPRPSREAMRALGMNRKITLDGRLATPAFRALRAARRLRGTPLDVFGRAGVRRVERELVGEYQALVRSALDRLEVDTVDGVVAVADTADLVRGYEDVKLGNVERFREQARAALAALTG